ncbi:hypothetical protein QEH42_gp089 [Microbacterium phage Pumpernickel]|uniref:Uncharacterized protein n=1 Tax=Microbacterium phage Pumpernickel TaxID=2885983 RepID=A0AAE8Y7E5_9CAUD|nr:hypothetical protein QEH42_gp089 [Microbacterium phage Pumpernickel]UDL15880.1 hypothetical protein SEA_PUMPERNICKEL_89 [Microbacterium phage Pumpernickel]
MAQTNFRAKDMKKGSGDKGGKPGEREDNKVLEGELEKLSVDPKGGNKVAQEYAKGKKASEQKLQDEISNTVEPDFDKSSKDVESPISEDTAADNKAATATGVADDDNKGDAAAGDGTTEDVKAEQIKEAEAKGTTVENTTAAKKTTTRKTAAKKADTKSDDSDSK